MLISVIVFTFNSSDTVLDTLNSLTRQFYSEMEVLVCDDGSTDSTQVLVRNWLDSHAHLFERAILLPSQKNEGICKNVKKGFSAARGEWIKPIAGDDLLEPEAIRKFAEAAELTDKDVLISLLRTFGGNTRDVSIMPTAGDIKLILAPPDLLRDGLINRNPIPAPCVLIRRSSYEAVGGVDISFKHLDDWPLWIRFVDLDMSFGILQEVLVLYRLSDSSVSSSRLATGINKDFINDLIIFFYKYQRSSLSPLHRWDRSIDIFRWRLAGGYLRRWPVLYKLTRVLYVLSPFAWLRVSRRYR